MGRLFWTFPDGLPGAGLFLIRLALAGGLMAPTLASVPSEPFATAALVVQATAAVLLLAGFVTPIGGATAAAIQIWRTYSDPGNAQTHMLLATLGAASALLGPGAFSVDARLFGWRRIDVTRTRGAASRPRMGDEPDTKDSGDAPN